MGKNEPDAKSQKHPYHEQKVDREGSRPSQEAGKKVLVTPTPVRVGGHMVEDDGQGGAPGTPPTPSIEGTAMHSNAMEADLEPGLSPELQPQSVVGKDVEVTRGPAEAPTKLR